jgi:hypothetical protein
VGAAEEIRNCRRKRAYPNQKEAEWAALDRLEFEPNAPKLRPYECFWCGYWHLSSGDSANRRGRRT